MPRIRIDIYSDTGCPWCYIGNKYLDLAIEQFSSRNPDAVFELAWHPFFLFPNDKVSACSKADVYRKIMGPERAASWFRSLEAAAEPLGIRFDWSGKTGHTGDSHKLLLRASDLGRASSCRGGGDDGVQQQQHPPELGAAAEPSGNSDDHGSSPNESGDNKNNKNNTNNNNNSSSSSGSGSAPLRRLLRHVFEGSFERGRDVSDRAFLAEAAVAAGVAADAADAHRWLDHPGSAARLAARTARGAEAAGVAGVPCFVVQGKFKVGGAQPPDVFLALFERLVVEEGRV